MRRSASLIATLLIIAVSMPVAVASLREIGKYFGIRKVVVPVVGTGSMYPSLFWVVGEGGPDDESKMAVEEYRTSPRMYHRFPGIKLGSRTVLSRQIARGDLVAFQSEATKRILEKEDKDPQSGFIKRVIGLPGDTIELRDGYVLRNGEKIEEPYIYKPRSTYGLSSLPDCQKLVIPAGQYFVLGDNRKTSVDSRSELGLVNLTDISFVLPYNDQEIYRSLWRDTSRDAELSGTPSLSPAEFYKLLNDRRREKGISSLRENKLLVRSSTIRGERSLAGQESSLKQSLAAAGYSNILTGEFVTTGHFSAEELLQNLLYFGDTAQQVLSSEYQDIGLSAVNRNVNGCPSQLIVGHLGGYLPPSYQPETVSSWQSLVANLEAVIPSWEKARAYEGVNQAKLAELLVILHRRLDLAREILGAMRDNKWLTGDQESRIKSDSADADRAEALINELNN